MSKKDDLTFAIIDSGIGGVSVLNQMLSQKILGNYIYYADNLFMPYGNKSKKWLAKRINSIICKLANEYNVDYFIIACNTASSSISETNYNNVIKLTFDKNLTYLTTSLTQRNLIGYKTIADKTLAKQIELNIYNKKKLFNIIKNHVKRLNLNNNKTLVLGCTHFELVYEYFKKLCPNTNIIRNSSYLKCINSKNQSNEKNVIVLQSKNDKELEDKIHYLIGR